jgi:UDP-N-acetylmuramate dehydrogenase
MNAGAWGTTISDRITRVRVLTYSDMTLHWLDQSAISFGYRSSKNDGVYLWVEFLLEVKDEKELKLKIAEIAAKRRSAQPLSKMSAGCIFKNPENDHAGRIIDSLGLKGLSIGGAEVSSIHANFIVNNGGAKSSEVYDLMRVIQSTVLAKTGVKLDTEVILKGSFGGKIFY